MPAAVQELEVKFMDDKVMGVAEFGSKTVTYLKSLSEIVVNLIDSINYLYVLNFKEEEDKKYHALQAAFPHPFILIRSISLLGASGDRPESRTGTGQLPSVLSELFLPRTSHLTSLRRNEGRRRRLYE